MPGLLMAPVRSIVATCVLGLALTATACDKSSDTESSSSATEPDVTCGGAAPFAAEGPFAAGVTTLDVDGDPVEIWYPADPEAARGKSRARYDMRDFLPPKWRGNIPDSETAFFEMSAYRDLVVSRKRRFPVVLFSHGLAGFRTQSSFLTAHLASWGFVVVAPEHVERNMAAVLEDLSKVDDRSPDQLRAAFARLKKEDAAAGGAFQGTLDFTRVAAMGHSMGGAATATLLDDAEVKTAIYLASPGFGEGTPGKQITMFAGTADGIATKLDEKFALQPPGKRFVAIRNAGHLAFTDICTIGEDRGGVLEIAQRHGIEVAALVTSLGRDGCDPAQYLPVRKAWPIVRHYTTASLATALQVEPLAGSDGRPRGLSPEARKCFGDLVSDFEEK